MDTKSKILFSVISLLIVASVVAAYYRFMVVHDYSVLAELECDPTEETCFVWECDSDVEDECTGDPEEDIWYYKLIEKDARNISLCNGTIEECDELSCEDGEVNCEIFLCTEEDELDGEECTDPEDFPIDEIVGQMEYEESILLPETIEGSEPTQMLEFYVDNGEAQGEVVTPNSGL